MENLLEDVAWKKVKCDPTTKTEKKISTTLKQCEEKGYITSKHRMHLTHQVSSTPQIYGLPKVHKEGIPLRPTVAAIGSPSHLLGKELVGILSRHVKNILQRIHQTSFAETDVMVNFDVVSLFTNVPVDEALWVISKHLQQDEALGEWTNIPVPELCHLVELWLRSTYFQFGESFFEQVQGAAMG